MTKEEALAKAIEALVRAEEELVANQTDNGWGWSILADTYINLSAQLEPRPEPRGGLAGYVMPAADDGSYGGMR